MISEIEKSELTEFLTSVSAMSVEHFTRASKHSIKSLEARSSARPLIALGATDFSWLDKRVRDVVGPLLVSMDWPDTRVAARAVGLVLDAAQGIIRRDRLTPEQYDAFVGGFRHVGVTVPAQSSAS